MPFSGSGKSAPGHVKGVSKRRQWEAVWNSAYDKCVKDGGSDKDCEGRAFAQANGTVKGDDSLDDELTGVLV
jgi:hypothetical protein